MVLKTQEIPLFLLTLLIITVKKIICNGAVVTSSLPHKCNELAFYYLALFPLTLCKEVFF